MRRMCIVIARVAARRALCRCVAGSAAILAMTSVGLGSSGSVETLRGQAQFEVTVDLMTLQIRVLGANKQFVTGLTTDDFALHINGEERPISVLYEISPHAGGTAPDEPSTAGPRNLEIAVGGRVPAAARALPADLARRMPPSTRRHFLFFMDLTTATPSSVIRARDAALRFLESFVAADDMVAVAAYSPSRGLEMLVPFTGYHALAMQALKSFFGADAAGRVPPAGQDVGLHELIEFEQEMSGSGELAEALSQQEEERYASVVASYLDSLTELGRALTAIQGRKYVVFFSRGLPDSVWEMKEGNPFGGTEAKQTEIREAAQAAAEALRLSDAVVHVLHPDILPVSDIHDLSEMESRLQMGPGEANKSASVMMDRQFLSFLADETGGTTSWYAHNLEEGLRDLHVQTNAYYVLGYERQPTDPPVVSIEVTCTEPGAAVVDAPTRLAAPPDFSKLDPMQRQMQLAEALEYGVDAQGMAVEARIVPLAERDNVGRFAVLLQVPIHEVARLARQRHDGRLELEIVGVAIDDGGRVADYFRNSVGIGTSRILEAPERYRVPFRYYDLVVVPPGDYRMKLIVREARLGDLSSRSFSLSVPRAESPPLLLVGPLRLARPQESFQVRGVRPTAPPRHRRGLPLDYPFQVAGVELVPDISPFMEPGNTYRILAIVSGLSVDPITDDPRPALDVGLVDASGSVRQVEHADIVDRSEDPEDGAVALLLSLTIPAALPAGPYQLRFTVTDGVTDELARSFMLISVTSRTEDRARESP